MEAKAREGSERTGGARLDELAGVARLLGDPDLATRGIGDPTRSAAEWAVRVALWQADVERVGTAMEALDFFRQPAIRCELPEAIVDIGWLSRELQRRLP